MVDMKIAVFGGTFDPPHIEHINIVKHIMHEFDVNRCIVLPNGNPPHKTNVPVTPACDRLNMVKLCFDRMDNVFVDDYEMTLTKPCYTSETLKHFSDCGKVLFVIGADSVAAINTWKNPEKIFELADVVAVGRGGYELNNKDKRFIYSDFFGREISSTDIRVMYEYDQSCDCVTPEVDAYIKEHKIYSEYTKYVSEVKKRTSPERFIHTMYTTMMAIKLNSCLKLNVDYAKLFIACTLHDIAKNMSFNEAEKFCAITEDLKHAQKKVLHAYLGAYVAKKLFPELDDEILSAIYYHTTFRERMSTLEMLVAIADSIEASRNYSGVDDLRRLTFENIDVGICAYLKKTVDYLVRKNEAIDPNTLKAYDYFKEKLYGKQD